MFIPKLSLRWARPDFWQILQWLGQSKSGDQLHFGHFGWTSFESSPFQFLVIRSSTQHLQEGPKMIRSNTKPWFLALYFIPRGSSGMMKWLRMTMTCPQSCFQSMTSAISIQAHQSDPFWGSLWILGVWKGFLKNKDVDSTSHYSDLLRSQPQIQPVSVNSPSGLIHPWESARPLHLLQLHVSPGRSRWIIWPPLEMGKWGYQMIQPL